MSNNIKKDSRIYPFFTKDNELVERKVNYTILLDNDIIQDIKNEYHSSIEKGSECWEYFEKKYSK